MVVLAQAAGVCGQGGHWGLMGISVLFPHVLFQGGFFSLNFSIRLHCLRVLSYHFPLPAAASDGL